MSCFSLVHSPLSWQHCMKSTIQINKTKQTNVKLKYPDHQTSLSSFSRKKKKKKKISSTNFCATLNMINLIFKRRIQTLAQTNHVTAGTMKHNWKNKSRVQCLWFRTHTVVRCSFCNRDKLTCWFKNVQKALCWDFEVDQWSTVIL